MNKDLLYQLALTFVPNVGAVHARILLQHFGLKEIFSIPARKLELIEGIGSIRANSIKNFRDFAKAEREIRFIEKFNIRTLFISDQDYPQRLLNCYDPPTLLYLKGSIDLNPSRSVSIVGTRNYTEYGKKFTEALVAGLEEHEVTVISGLAMGIDSIAHTQSLKHSLPTVGVVGHGLDIIYPFENTGLAREIVKQGGGILTQFPSKTGPDKHNFPIRNRIVAGLSDAVVIVETGIRGGSMITAEMGNGYNRDVFAVPGRAIDDKSSGCNDLIRNNKAILLTDVEELLEVMGWANKKVKKKKQQEIFIELSPADKILADLMKEQEIISIDELNLRSGLSNSEVAAALLNLELHNLVKSLPGKRYTLL